MMSSMLSQISTTSAAASAAATTTTTTTTSSGSSSSAAAAAAAAVPGATTSTTTKKRFGKNLNKLVKPQQAPPITNASAKSTYASRNGLLLLSTNKRSSSTTAAAAGGGTTAGDNNAANNTAANTNAPSPTKTGSNLVKSAIQASTHDVLVNAVANAQHQHAHNPGDGSPYQPDAWGVSSASAEKEHAQQQQHGGSALSEPPHQQQAAARGAAGDDRDRHMDGDPHNGPPPTKVDWNEYGGRGEMTQRGNRNHNASADGYNDHDNSRNGAANHPHAALIDPETGKPVTDQVSYMTRLARERAAKRRTEEDRRRAEQRERADRRLHELDGGEDNNNNNNNNDHLHHRDGGGTSTRGLWEPGQQQQHQQRNEKQEDRSRKNQNSKTDANAAVPGATKARSGSYGATDDSVGGGDNENTTTGPVIHLDSYEDRDRGERGTAGGGAEKPRMLYDPKSGAMVAVKSRRGGDVAPISPTNGAKPSSRQQRNSRQQQDRGNKRKGKDPANTKAGDAVTESTSGRRKIVLKAKQVDDEGRNDAAVRGAAGTTSSRRSNNTTGRRQRLPRTCGVLYTRNGARKGAVLFARDDSKGNLYVVDGCEGDLGYGAHSVPGGRAKNRRAYATYVEEQKHQRKTRRVLVNSERHGANDAGGMMYELHGGMIDNSGGDVAVGLYTGFNPLEEGGDLNIGLQEAEPAAVEWVKAGERIELVTGVDDYSPTLKPTAREFAPSQFAAPAVAAGSPDPPQDAATIQSGASIASSSQPHESEVEEDRHDDPLGLGFDPTQDMDLVMSSPAPGMEQQIADAVDLNALTLEPSVFDGSAAAATNDAGPRHIFAFGTSGTWGAHEMAAAVNTADWGAPSATTSSNLNGAAAGATNNPAGGLFGTAAGFNNGDAKEAPVTSAFLNIPSSDWGAPDAILPSLGEEGTSPD